MLSKIKKLSALAQQAIASEILMHNEGTQAYKDLNALLAAYSQLDALIVAAEKQHATAGLVILSRQLHKTADELNAAEVLENFLSVLDLPATTSFNMNQDPFNEEPHETSRLNTAKLFSMAPLLFMVVMVAIMLPSLLMSPLPWLYLAISALPLLITYGFDKPFSMSRWYQEMAGIEKGLGYSILFFGAICLIAIACTVPPIATGLQIVMTTMSTLISGASLVQHSKHLQKKHEALKNTQEDINTKVSTHLLKDIFKPASDTNPKPQSEVVSNMVATLSTMS